MVLGAMSWKTASKEALAGAGLGTAMRKVRPSSMVKLDHVKPVSASLTETESDWARAADS